MSDVNTTANFAKLDKKLDQLGAQLNLLSQKIDLYDVEQIRKNQQELQQSITALNLAMKAGGGVAMLVLAAVITLMFQVFAA